MVVQIHYDIALPGGDFHSPTQIALEFDEHAREATVVPIMAQGTLAPGQRYVTVDTQKPAPASGGHLIGVAPRMHIRGQTMLLEVERAHDHRCLAEFDHWHFHDQQLFEPDPPIALAPGDRLHLSCSYNTTGRTAPTPFGEGIDEEECVAYLFVTR